MFRIATCDKSKGKIAYVPAGNLPLQRPHVCQRCFKDIGFPLIDIRSYECTFRYKGFVSTVFRVQFITTLSFLAPSPNFPILLFHLLVSLSSFLIPLRANRS